MKKNKGKNMASETEEDVEIMDDSTPLVVQTLTIQHAAGKRKGISSNVDLGSLPSRRGVKNLKMGKSYSSKTAKPKDSTVDLDDPTTNLVPPQPSSAVQTEASLPSTSKPPHRSHPSISTKDLPNLVLDEDHAWETFNGIVTDREVKACQNMSVKDFEHSVIHDFFKLRIVLIYIVILVGFREIS